MRRHVLVAGFGAIALLLGSITAGSQAPVASADSAAQPSQAEYQQYTIIGPETREQRTEVAATGVAIDEVRDTEIVVTASASEAGAVEQLGYQVEPLVPVAPFDLPPGYEDYHDYDEMMQVVDQVVAAHPTIATKHVIGQSHEGRDIVAVKISDNVAVEEGEPEVLFTHSQHGREILTVEMAIYLLHLFTDNYGSDPRITDLVDERVIWILPNVNPDGSEWDKTATGFRFWRKNRQPNPGTSAVGTDTNRNWDYLWGCCGGSSGNPSSQTYRGAFPESAPEVNVVADFVRSRVIDGQQMITSHIDWHTYGELILFPYGYTFANTAPGLDATDRQAFVALGQAMGQTNGYTVQQSSDLYITDGSIGDWMWGEHRIFSYTYEMFPRTSNPGFYPQDSFIESETSRNEEAVLRFVEYADCPYAIIGVSCQDDPEPPATVFFDDFETDQGWVVNPAGTDTATLGLWERANPQATSWQGIPLQLGTTPSGVNALATGPLAGSGPGAHDIDDGVTSVRSPEVTLPSSGTSTLTAEWYLAHLSNSSAADYVRVSVVSGTTTTTVFEQLASASNRPASWGTLTADLTPWAGESIYLLIEAADEANPSLVEAAVDDVRITHQN